jgi:acylphosphatase
MARRLGLRGYVRNLPNGSVEVVAEGTKGLIEELIDDLRRGPMFGHVSGIQVEWQECRGDLDGFRVAF